MKKLIALFLLLTAFGAQAQSSRAKGNHFFELKVYEYKTAAQEALIDSYLSQAFLPFMHSKGIAHIGVFT